MKPINKEDLSQEGNYEGYLWRSDSRTPDIIDAKNPFSSEKLKGLPFVLEGWLYDADKQISIQIKNLDGKYFITKYNLEQLRESDDKQLEPQEYIAYRLEGVKRVKFSCLWQLEEQETLKSSPSDQSDYSFKTYTPKAHIFTGFIK